MIRHVAGADAGTFRMFCAGLAFSLLTAATSAQADPIENFYKGKNLQFLVGVSAGGGYDLQMRLVARHIVRFIPGNPTPVPQNMTGATGLVMANYLYRVAPRDGTAIGLIQNGLPTYQAVGKEGVQFDVRQFQWLGALTPTTETMIAWKTTGVHTIAEARSKEIIAGSNGTSGITYIYPVMLNDLAGTKFKMITGYPGSSALNLAMERGEVEARNNSWDSIKSTKPNWIANRDVSILVYSGLKPDELKDVPELDDVISDANDRLVARVVTSGNRLGYPFTVMPGVPAERVAALRSAFVAMTKDPEFLKEAAAAQIEVNPISPQRMHDNIEALFAVPEPLKQRARKYFEQ